MRKNYSGRAISLRDDIWEIISDSMVNIDGEADKVQTFLDGKECTKMIDDIIDKIEEHCDNAMEVLLG